MGKKILYIDRGENMLKELLKQKISEALSSVLPITAIVLILSFTNIAPMPAGMMILFMFGAVMLIVGMGFFSLGADLSMMPMGTEAGRKIFGRGKLRIILPVCFFIGFAITIAEPDLQVLAHQFTAMPDMVIIITVAVGVGVFLVIAAMREYFGIKLRTLLIIFYALIFLLSLFVRKDFLPLAFDSGGVTTGPITVPFIMALGIGVAAMSKNESEESSFGLVALCSIGPILAVMIMGMTVDSAAVYAPDFDIPDIIDSQQAGRQFAEGFPVYIKEVAFGLTPIMVFFAAFQIITHSFSRKSIIKILVGTVYTYIGLVLFLTGVNVGFMPVGNYIGKQIASLDYNIILVPLGMIMGYFIVVAEPAVHVLKKQVEELTNGAIPAKSMLLSLSVGVALSVGISMIRVLYGIEIYKIIVPGYLVAILLSFFVPEVFTAIAFDSGGVASGPMTATFLLPFAMGVCDAVGGNVLTDAFGLVAMVAMTPLITIQILGLVYKYKEKKAFRFVADEEGFVIDDIIDYTLDEEVCLWRDMAAKE